MINIANSIYHCQFQFAKENNFVCIQVFTVKVLPPPIPIKWNPVTFPFKVFHILNWFFTYSKTTGFLFCVCFASHYPIYLPFFIPFLLPFFSTLIIFLKKFPN